MSNCTQQSAGCQKGRPIKAGRLYYMKLLLITLLFGRQEGHPASKNWVLVCWWWRFDWSFERLFIAPIAATTSITLSSSKTRNGDILVPANPGPPGKWPLKRRETETERDSQSTNTDINSHADYIPFINSQIQSLVDRFHTKSVDGDDLIGLGASHTLVFRRPFLCCCRTACLEQFARCCP